MFSSSYLKSTALNTCILGRKIAINYKQCPLLESKRKAVEIRHACGCGLSVLFMWRVANPYLAEGRKEHHESWFGFFLALHILTHLIHSSYKSNNNHALNWWIRFKTLFRLESCLWLFVWHASPYLGQCSSLKYCYFPPFTFTLMLQAAQL